MKRNGPVDRFVADCPSRPRGEAKDGGLPKAIRVTPAASTITGRRIDTMCRSSFIVEIPRVPAFEHFRGWRIYYSFSALSGQRLGAIVSL